MLAHMIARVTKILNILLSLFRFLHSDLVSDQAERSYCDRALMSKELGAKENIPDEFNTMPSPPCPRYLFLGNKFVSRTVYRLKMHRTRGVGFQFLS
jgi:hypothetical protein